MSDILKFSCLAPNCGRKFSTQEALNTHFDLRHPELKQEKENKPSIEKIIKQISKPKLNPQEKHHFLQPITKRKSKAKIVTNNNTNKEIKEEKNKKEIIEEDIDTKNIPIYIEEKEKRLLNNNHDKKYNELYEHCKEIENELNDVKLENENNKKKKNQNIELAQKIEEINAENEKYRKNEDVLKQLQDKKIVEINSDFELEKQNYKKKIDEIEKNLREAEGKLDKRT